MGLAVPTGEAIRASACPVGAERANLRGVRIVLIG